MVAVLAIAALAQQAPAFTQASISGIVVTDFEAPQGRIRVYLPDDMRAGDTISGTVYVEPKGTGTDREANAKVLSGLVVSIDSDLGVLDGPRLVVRGMDKTHRLQRSLKVRVFSTGTEFTAPVKVGPNSSDSAKNFVIPAISPSGRPLNIVGPFDGDTGNTKADLGGKEAAVLAETPRTCVVQVDPSYIGPKSVNLSENGKATTGTVVLPRLTLSAPKLALLRGESTVLTVQVTGLEGLSDKAYPIPIELVNLTPGVINLSDRTNFGVEAREVRSGTWTKNFIITASQAGNYTITGLLFCVPLHDAKKAMSVEEFNQWLQGLKVLYTERLKTLQAEAAAQAERNNGKVDAGLEGNIGRKKKLLTTIDTFAGLSDAGEKAVAADAIDALLAGEAMFTLAADLISLAADLLGYTEIPLPGLGHLIKGAKAVAKNLPKTLAALEKAEKLHEELEKLKDAKEKLDKAKELKDAIDNAKKVMDGEK